MRSKFGSAVNAFLSCFDIEPGKSEREGRPSYAISLFVFHKSFGRGGRNGGTFGIEFRVTCHTYFIATFEKSRKKWEQLFVGHTPKGCEGRARFVFSLRILRRRSFNSNALITNWWRTKRLSKCENRTSRCWILYDVIACYWYSRGAVNFATYLINISFWRGKR